MKTWGLKTVLLNAIVFLILAYILPGVTVTSAGSALLGAVVLAVMNLILGFVLRAIALPINVVTFGCLTGLFSLIINAVVLMVMDNLVEGIAFGSFWTAVIVAFVLGLAQMAILRD